jgi:GntR family transcriptional repressor for pyruvate dehydrogenase complex
MLVRMVKSRKKKKAPIEATRKGFSAKRLANNLRKELLEFEKGAFFGYEDDLLERLQVSRPTLRQAARVLEHDQLLRVRRGPHGGYYADRPDVQSVINAASLYLYDRGTRLDDLVEAARGCVTTLVRLAAESNDKEARRALREQLKSYVATNFCNLPHFEFLRAESALVTALARMAGNPPLELVIRILYGCGLGVTSDKIFEGRPDRIEACFELRVRIVEAVLAGDGELAKLHDARASNLRRSYLQEDGAHVPQDASASSRIERSAA